LLKNLQMKSWHTQAILQHGDNPAPLVLLRAHRNAAQDAVQIFIYTRDQPNLFATTVAVLDRMTLMFKMPELLRQVLLLV
jgi:[protein-PII] uridylyltransferase